MNGSNLTKDVSVVRARVERAVRDQIQWRDASLDQLIPKDHRVRAVWAYVDSLDLTALYQKIRAVEGGVGRDAADPKILMALWMWAIIEGISSARHVHRLCERDFAYMWIGGEVGVNYHLLSDFRTDHGEFLDELLTDTIATLMYQKIVTLETVAQDGMRVRAHAGSGSFRRKKTLEKCRQEAAEQVKRLREESDDDSANGQDASNARRQAAVERAAREREELVAAALKNLEQLQQQNGDRKKGSVEQARCSTTDPEARQMKMGDGAFRNTTRRPAYNVQFATDGHTRMIVSVEVTNNGSDGAPPARPAHDTDAMFAFRQRMTTDDSKAILKQRPSIAEFPNAECRNRGLEKTRNHQAPQQKTAAGKNEPNPLSEKTHSLFG